MIALFEKLYKDSEASFFQLLQQRLLHQEKTFIITANPEIFMKGEKDQELIKSMLDKDSIITPDGEGIVYAARQLGYRVWGKIAGVDTVSYLFSLAHQNASSLFIYGSAQAVLDKLENRLKSEYPNIKIAGLLNGYDYDEKSAFDKMSEVQPDIVLVALGVPRQEKAIADHLAMFDHGIFVGCGGSLDVLSGSKKRAPKIFIQLRLEWAYRLAKEPKRIKRFYDSNVKFLFKIRKLKKVKS